MVGLCCIVEEEEFAFHFVLLPSIIVKDFARCCFPVVMVVVKVPKLSSFDSSWLDEDELFDLTRPFDPLRTTVTLLLPSFWLFSSLDLRLGPAAGSALALLLCDRRSVLDRRLDVLVSPLFRRTFTTFFAIPGPIRGPTEGVLEARLAGLLINTFGGAVGGGGGAVEDGAVKIVKGGSAVVVVRDQRGFRSIPGRKDGDF